MPADVPLRAARPASAHGSRNPSPPEAWAPFVAAHLSVEDGEGERDVWMSRYAAFLTASGVEPRQAAAAWEKVERELPILTPAQDETILREAGFGEVHLFYVGFTFRGWVAYA